MEQVSNTIIQKINLMAGAPSTDPMLWSKFKAISALFPYAARLAQGEQREMFEVILHVSSKLSSRGFMWRRIGTSIISWFHESSPPSLNHAITIGAPCADWTRDLYTQVAVARWAAAVSATPYSDAVCQSAVGALLLIAYNNTLRPQIPIEIWALLKRQPLLPAICRGRMWGTTQDVVRHIRGLGDIELLKSYFLLVWSEWNYLFFDGLGEMKEIIREEFCGIAMLRDREDLTERLDHVLRQLNRGVEYLQQHNPQIREDHITLPKFQYEQLKETLAKKDREAMKTLSSTTLNLVLSM